MRHKQTLERIAALESEPHWQAVGVWSPYIEQGDISIPKMTKERKNKPSQVSRTWLRSADFHMTIKHVLKGQFCHQYTRIEFALDPKIHGINKVFKIALAHLVRFVETEQGTHIVIAKEVGLKMFYGHNFAGQWIPPKQWGLDDSHEYYNN